jgi:uncharacterized protein YndB with AHSA1/START domain
MITVEKSIVIERPAEDVFTYVSDQTNATHWQRGLLEVRRTTDDPVGIGTRHTFLRTFMGRRMEGSNEYTRWEPNKLVAFRATSGPVALDASYLVEPIGTDGAQLTSRIEIRHSGLFRLAEPLMAAGLKRDVEANLRVLKGLLESSAQVQTISRVPWLSWGPLATVATFAALSALWVALTPAGDQTELAGRTWGEFAVQDPEVAYLFSRQLQILGLLGAGFGLLAAFVSVIPYRRGERWAWYALWLFPFTIGAVAGRMLIDQYSTGYYYAGLTAVALVALLLPMRDFLRPPERGSQP